MNADGSGMRRITTTKNGRDLDAVWTASGEEIVFASDRDGSFDLYHTTLSGGPREPSDALRWDCA